VLPWDGSDLVNRKSKHFGRRAGPDSSFAARLAQRWGTGRCSPSYSTGFAPGAARITLSPLVDRSPTSSDPTLKTAYVTPYCCDDGQVSLTTLPTNPSKRGVPG
jgi:hypothetical protein